MASTDVIIEITVDIHESLFVLYKKQDKGSFCVKNFDDIRFEFDTYQGLLTPVSIGQPKGINTFFNPSLFGNIIQPSNDVMALLASMEIIIALKNMGDRHISLVIADSIDQPSYNQSRQFCDKTLAKILHLLNPPRLRFHTVQPEQSHLIILSVLNGLEKPIQSKEEAVKIMKTIYEKLNLDTAHLILK